MSWAASLPRAELVLRNQIVFEQATCPGQPRCRGQNFFSKKLIFLNKPIVPGSFAAGGRTFSQKSELSRILDSCAQNKTSEIAKTARSGILRLLCAEITKEMTFWNSGTPVRRTKRRKSQKLHFHKFWHSGAQRGAAFGRPPLWFPLHWL